jgi:hypothetical protein
MRHFFALPPAVAPLSLGMAMATTARMLVTSPGRAQRLVARRARTTLIAIALTAIAGRTNHHLAAAAGT